MNSEEANYPLVPKLIHIEKYTVKSGVAFFLMLWTPRTLIVTTLALYGFNIQKLATTKEDKYGV